MSFPYKSLLGAGVLFGITFCGFLAPLYAQNGSSRNSPSPVAATNLDSPHQSPGPSRLKTPADGNEQQSPEFRMGPGDLLDITVFEAPDMNRTVRVEGNGEISLPLLGSVRAAGLTPAQLESVLQELLRRTYIKDPHIGVFVRELESHPVSVVGAVKQPGVFQIRGTKTVIEMLSMAQGLTDDAGDTVLIVHGGKTPGELSIQTSDQTGHIEKISLKQLLDSADPSLNVSVHPGDVVKVPRAGIVYVVGEVARPGGFVLQSNESISVLQALALAGGPTHTSGLRHARIIRTDVTSGKRAEIAMNLGRILSGKSPDVPLQPKDIVFVPNNAAKSALYRGSEAALQTATGVAIYRW